MAIPKKGTRLINVDGKIYRWFAKVDEDYSYYEVIVEALRLLEERDKEYEKWLEAAKEKVAIGMAQLDRGEGLNGEVVIARLREKLKKLP
jgi:predicted transcriptional regulator